MVFLSGWFLIFCLCASATAGACYHYDKAENTPVYFQEDDSWIVNAPTVIPLSPGINFIREVGYYYLGDVAGKDQGYQWYVGVKWQIDFRVDSLTLFMTDAALKQLQTSNGWKVAHDGNVTHRRKTKSWPKSSF